MWHNREQDYEKGTSPAPYINKNTILVTRIISFLITQALFWMEIVLVNKTFFTYFTYWGITLTMLTFTLMMITHLYEMREMRQQSASGQLLPNGSESARTMSTASPQNRRLQRLVGIIFSQTIAFEMVIVVVFWGLLYPTKKNPSSFDQFRTCADHSVCFGLLVIDFCLNGISINPYHAIFATLFQLFYMVVNAIVTSVRGYPVYSIMTWKDVKTFIFVIAGLIFVAVCFLFFAYLSILKKRLFEKPIEEKIHVGYSEDCLKQVESNQQDDESLEISSTQDESKRYDRNSTIQK